MLKIYDMQPVDWKDLQDKVAKIFSDMGYATSTEKTIELVRGNVEVDVFAKRTKPKTVKIKVVECKFWNTPVPKQIVHSFRTVITDYNIQAGYIVSKEGYQKGAKEAAENSNVYLLTFEEFQEEFFKEWLSSVVDELDYIGQPLRKYCDYMEDFYDSELNKLSDNKQQKFFNLIKKYMSTCGISSRLFYKHLLTGQLEMEYVESTVDRYINNISDKVQINCLMEYFDYAKSYCQAGLNQIDSLFENPPRHWTSIDLIKNYTKQPS